MSIGISEDHVELAASLRRWAAGIGGIEAIRVAETDAEATFDDIWKAVGTMGLVNIGLPVSAGGDGGSTLDVSVALEACAVQLVPGALLGTAVAATVLGDIEVVASALGEGAVVGIGLVASLVVTGPSLTGTVEVVWDAPGATHFLLGATGGPDATAESWYVVPATQVDVTAQLGVDLSRRFARVSVEALVADAVPVSGLTSQRLRRVAVTYAAAEASGVARWCLQTAVDYAKVREQFGKKIGSFQAIKHLCAQMLETAEAVTAVAWDVASVGDADDQQWAFSADVATAVAFDGAVEVAKSCIQVLGGIGFTFEHDAHFYLRRALALRGLFGDGDAAAERLTAQATSGVRRTLQLALEGRDEDIRDEVRANVDAVASLSAGNQRAGLVEVGYLAPHWPAPYGLGADAVEQIVIDQELARAGVTRPDIVIAGWVLPTILEFGLDEQREKFVRASLLGELVWCQLFSEPGSGSDLASLRTRAEKVDGGWKLTGQKVWTSLAERADWGVCLARTNPDVAQHKGISYFLVDMSSAGIDIRPLREITGQELFNEVFLDEVFVPDDCLVGEVDDGWRLARATLANERVAMASSRLSKSTERAIELAAAGLTAAQRVKVGHSVALATVCTLLGVRTTLRSLAGQGPGAESSVAKLLGVRNRQDGAELVVSLQADQLVAYTEAMEADVLEMLNTRCLSIAGGTTQILRNVAGERILGLPR